MKYTKDELLDLTLSNEDINLDKVYKNKNSSDEEIRQCVAELLSYDNTQTSLDILINYLKKDISELVRTEAANSLGKYSSEDLILILLELFKEEISKIVQSYILFSIIDIHQKRNYANLTSEICNIYHTNESETIKIICMGYLLRSGYTSDFEYLFNCLESTDYYIRIHTIREISKSCTDDNINHIQEKLKVYNLVNEECLVVVEFIHGILAYHK